MLRGLFKPGLEATRGRSAGPVLVPVPSRWIHDTRNMARSGENEPDWTSETLRSHEHRPRRCNMVLAGSQVVDRDLHLREVESGTANLHSALGKIVVQIAPTQIEAVVRRRHARRIRVPIEQVERTGLLPPHIDVDDV